ncbi:DgyrCDS2139 [Dimorphilus gyrociliatus]|uniref:DgyrCDS2139 n=1 Tax=Dimorphilus gyrociliatus TaxID=2664684 RepID=A0A7I8VC62_9ANNE|nr:DgyrCDS2139 [Dimorphilus gyrociliatus]
MAVDFCVSLFSDEEDEKEFTTKREFSDPLRMFRYCAHSERDITNDWNSKAEWTGEKWSETVKASNFSESFTEDRKRVNRKRKAYSVLVEHPVGELEQSPTVKLHLEGSQLAVGLQEQLINKVNLDAYPDLDLSTLSCKVKKGYFILKSGSSRSRKWSGDSRKRVYCDENGDRMLQFLIPIRHGSIPEQVTWAYKKIIREILEKKRKASIKKTSKCYKVKEKNRLT